MAVAGTTWGTGFWCKGYLGWRKPSWSRLGYASPAASPQEMLRNWAESEELQQQFYLFQLQEKDKRLLELDTGLDEASVLVG